MNHHIKPLGAVLSALVTASFLISLAQIHAVTLNESDNEYNRQYRQNYEVPLGSQYTGRSPFMKPTGEAPPPPPPRAVAPPAVPAAPRANCTEPTGGLVRLG